MDAAPPSPSDDSRDRAPPRFVIGCGTGRCGTVSLAHLLSLQPQTVVGHESMLLPWAFDARAFAAYLRMLRARARTARVVADVAFYLLPYLDHLRAAEPDLRVICLERDRGAVVESYLHKTPGRNHWSRGLHRGAARPDPVWDRCYPEFDAPKREAIGRYWDLYARRIRALEGPAVRRVPTTHLNDPAAVRALLTFAGYAAAEQVPAARIHLNRRGQTS